VKGQSNSDIAGLLRKLF